jgi:hypothetical protein
VNGIGRLLRRCGVRLSLREDRVIAKARRWACLAALQESGVAGWRRARSFDWKDEWVLTPLRLLLRDIEHDRGLTPVGRLVARGSLIVPLTARMRIAELRTREPEIFEREVARPVFVIGFARTGTTLLYSLLAQDARARAPRVWEAMAPVPPPDPARRGKDPRFKRTERLVKAQGRVAPGLDVAHAVDPHGPEEDLPLLANAFLNPWHAWFQATGYLEWYAGLPEDEAVLAYEHHRSQLQILQWRHRGDYWLLKQAGHQFHLGALLRVYPDALLIQTHRDPLVSIPSLCSLAAFYRSIVADEVVVSEIGAISLEAFVEASRRSIEVRQRVGDGRFFDVAYERLVADPIQVVREVYDRFGLRYESGFEEGMESWLAENRQHRRGVHHYSLEQFGLDPAEVERQTAFYRERFAEHLTGTVPA